MKIDKGTDNATSNLSTSLPSRQDNGAKEHSTDKPDSTLSGLSKVRRRNNKVTAFDSKKISVAMTKAFLAVEGSTAAASTRIHQKIEELTEEITNTLAKKFTTGIVHIENIQDQIEAALMQKGEHKVARAYVLYREKQAKKRKQSSSARDDEPSINILLQNGTSAPLDKKGLHNTIYEACEGLGDVDPKYLIRTSFDNLYDGIEEKTLNEALVLSARGMMGQEPNYSQVAARLLLDGLRYEVLSFIENKPYRATHQKMVSLYPDYFEKYISQAVELGLLDKELTTYDLPKLGKALQAYRDLQFNYLGLQNLYDRYFIHHRLTRFELPQAFFMRVAMGLAINEERREERTIEFYELLSSFDFMSSTPTLFNSGTPRPQLSSCYLSTIPDDLHGIFSAIKDDALLSKFAGGLGNDWTQVRAQGSHIKGTNGMSNGIVPFLKVANDTAVAVNQGGKRKGAMCAYLETWHLDIESFLDLRRNTGDERIRTHDMNTAHWIPDLFMQRVIQNKDWTLFSPHETLDLHDLYGKAFEKRYTEYEQLAKQGDTEMLHKTLPAITLWRKMLTMLFETGHPWITFKDPCNIRSPQSHSGVVHSSNLCTEITLNTSAEEIAVCNLGSVNLPRHIDEDGNLDMKKLERTITTAMRMLDNVIDYNYYSVPQARNSNLRHRPVGLGMMGFHDSLCKMRIPYASEEAVEFADSSMEAISYFAIQGSYLLAKERGTYPSYDGSLWSKGILPIDSIKLLAKERDKEQLTIDETQRMDWDTLRENIRQHGIRNSNCLAIAPTATISNICGTSPSIDPYHQNLYVKSNISGEFLSVNRYLVKDLKERGLWDEVMLQDFKYYDGRLHHINRVPDELKELYLTAFEFDSEWLVKAASRRQKWIDQAQSLNLYLAENDGAKADKLYKTAWQSGLKTTYYLRALGATQMEKEPILEENEYTTSVCDGLSPDECESCQ